MFGILLMPARMTLSVKVLVLTPISKSELSCLFFEKSDLKPFQSACSVLNLSILGPVYSFMDLKLNLIIWGIWSLPNESL